MADQDRIAYLVQKLKTAKITVASLTTYVSGDNPNPIQANLRLKTLTKQFEECVEFHDELLVTEPTNAILQEWVVIEAGYYEVATKVTELQPPVVSPLGNTLLNSTIRSHSERHQYPKVPVTQLTKFDGTNPSEWLSFKNRFVAVIDSRDDLSNLVKHVRLEDALEGEAKLKISEYPPSEENYPLAWQALLDAYDQKRFLVTKHLDAFYDLPDVNPKDVATSLTMIVDKTKQHLHMLKQLGVNIGEAAVIRWLERRLPDGLKSKWQETLNMNDLPTLKQFYDFCSQNVFRIRSLQHASGSNQGQKRLGTHFPQPPNKSSKSGSRSFVTTSSNTSATISEPPKSTTCPLCKKDHRLFKCPDFHKLGPRGCFDFVKTNRLCSNCLLDHSTISCSNSNRCRKCNKKHHTALHFDKESTNASKTSQPAVPNA